MVNIVTGPINSGKTTKMIGIHNDIGGDGIVSKKLMDVCDVIGFNLIRLTTGEEVPFIRRTDRKIVGWNECCRLGPYTVSAEAVSWAVDFIRMYIRKEEGPVYLDEIGALEINDKCFHDVLKEILESGAETYITVRDGNLEVVKEKFGITGARIIHTGERYA